MERAESRCGARPPERCARARRHRGLILFDVLSRNTDGVVDPYLGGGLFHLPFHLQVENALVKIDASVDLAEWTTISTNFLSAGHYLFAEPVAAGATNRYFRVLTIREGTGTNTPPIIDTNAPPIVETNGPPIISSNSILQSWIGRLDLRLRELPGSRTRSR